jgi:hypothetical protein
MRAHTAFVIAGIASLAALSAAVPAAARPAASLKPTGAIFFSRVNATQTNQLNLVMTGAGTNVRHSPGKRLSTFAASGARLLAYTADSGTTSAIGIANFGGKQLHLYKPKGFVNVYSISPNGKYLGIEIDGKGQTQTYAISTLKGKVVAKLFSFNSSTILPEVDESWNSTSTQLVVLDSVTKTGTTTTSLKIYNLHGKVLKTLVKNAGLSFSVAWSASGDVAFSSGHLIKEIADTGGKVSTLLTSKNFPDGGLWYSPNGGFLAYGLNIGNTQQQIWRINSDGTHNVKLNANGYTPVWG